MKIKTHYDVKGAAEILNLTPNTVRAMCVDGRIKAKQIGGKNGRWRINVRVIEELMR